MRAAPWHDRPVSPPVREGRRKGLGLTPKAGSALSGSSDDQSQRRPTRTAWVVTRKRPVRPAGDGGRRHHHHRGGVLGRPPRHGDGAGRGIRVGIGGGHGGVGGPDAGRTAECTFFLLGTFPLPLFVADLGRRRDGEPYFDRLWLGKS